MFKPTGLYYYYEFRLSSSTQNDEGPKFQIKSKLLIF